MRHFFRKEINKYIKRGWFSSYPKDHILYPAINGLEVKKTQEKENFSDIICIFYDTFVINYERCILYAANIFKGKEYKKLIVDFLACKDGYSDEVFFERYILFLTVLYVCQYNTEIVGCEFVECGDGYLFRLKKQRGEIINLVSASISQSLERVIKKDTIDFEIGLKEGDIRLVEELLEKSEASAHIAYGQIGEIVGMINRCAPLFQEKLSENVRNIIILNMTSDVIERFNIHTIEGILINEISGLFRNDFLYEEYRIDDENIETISGVLILRNMAGLLCMGDFRYVVQEEDNYSFCINGNGNRLDGIFPYMHASQWNDLYFCIYNHDKADYEKCQAAVKFAIADYPSFNKESLLFSNRESYEIREYIRLVLDEYPVLYKRFEMDKQTAVNNIFRGYEWVKEKTSNFPAGHPLKSKTVWCDAVGFSLAYCSYVIPQYLGNSDIIDDMVNKKLKSAVAGKFCTKIFNENYSEFEIFFFLFSSIFFFSDLYKDFVDIKYEPNGNDNKRFEYSFVFKDKTVNVEVKALEVAPEDTDRIRFFDMKDGELFYKNYFKQDDIPEEVVRNAIPLKSNYRQVGKNIKRIKKKCENMNGKNVNIGFLMINFGTSREEFFSYLFNPEYGYLQKNGLENIHALCLFSMCFNTDLMMENILKNKHIFTVSDKKDDLFYAELFKKLRIYNYIWNDEDCPYFKYYKETWKIYEGIKRNGIVTIQPQGLSKEDIDEVIEDYWKLYKNKNILYK